MMVPGFSLGMIVWAVTAVILAILFGLVLGKFYFSGILGFESKSRRALIKYGMAALCASFAFMLLLPVIIVNVVTPEAQQCIMESVGRKTVHSWHDFAIINFLAAVGIKSWGAIALGSAIGLCIVFAVMVFVVIFTLREKERKSEEKNARHHVFEVDEALFEKMNGNGF